MKFHVPKGLAVLVIIGLVLLAVAGAADSITTAMRDNYNLDCHVYGHSFQDRPDPVSNETTNETDDPPPTKQEREDCRSARLPITVVDAIKGAALGPGIAIVAISAVFMIAAAIAARRR